MKTPAIDSTNSRTQSRIADDVAQHPMKAGPFSRSGSTPADGGRSQAGQWVRSHAHDVVQRTSNLFRPMQGLVSDIRSGIGRRNAHELGNAAGIQFASLAFPNNAFLAQSRQTPVAQVVPSAPPADVFEAPYSAHPYPAFGAQGMPVAPNAVLPLPGFQSDTPLPRSGFEGQASWL